MKSRPALWAMALAVLAQGSNPDACRAAPAAVPGAAAAPGDDMLVMLPIIMAGWAGLHTGGSVSSLDQNDPMTWLTKSVCVGADDIPLRVDPYDGCPLGAKIRKIRLGESLPYYNGDNVGSQWNNFPIRTANGQTLVLNARQFKINDQIGFDHKFRSQDQFDVYAINVNNDGWVSAPNTRDGGGYNTTFFGPRCALGGGWKTFPAAGFLSGGVTQLTIQGSYWQQSGQSFPGTCSSPSPSIAQTEWKYLPRHKFGGVNGGPIKVMDTIQSIHGFEPDTTGNFKKSGHIETFYFTREYGITRWEVWMPKEHQPIPPYETGPPVKTANCVTHMPDDFVYPSPTAGGQPGLDFLISDCRDNSDVLPAEVLELPVLPVPNLNMLKHANFDFLDGPNPNGEWHRAGNSPAGKTVGWRPLLSTALPDVQYGKVGVRYLRIDCGAGADGLCGADASPPVSQQVYQELDIKQFTSGQSYAYGISARVKNPPSLGQKSPEILISLQQLDASGTKVLWQDSFKSDIDKDNGNAGKPKSVFLSSGFYFHRLQMPIMAGAAKVRFFITPLTPQKFDVLEAWLAPY